MLINRRIDVPAIGIAIFLATALYPASAQPSKSTPSSKRAAAARTARTAVTTPQPNQPPPAMAARVDLVDGQLTVEAHNSELGPILQEISRVTGMSVTGGLKGGPRIFGVYGPAHPRSVVTTLLAASGYGFLLVGGDAAPRQLVLTPETKRTPLIAEAPQPLDEYAQQYAELDSDGPDRR